MASTDPQTQRHTQLQMFQDEQEPGRRRSLFGDVLLPGALVGALGAAVMAVVASGISVVAGLSAWTPEFVVAGLFFRNTDPSGVAAALLGLAVHFAVSIGIATAFAALLPRSGTQMAAMLLGAGFGLTLQVLMPQLVVPFASPTLDRLAPWGAMYFLHLIFGLTLGLVPTVRDIFGARVEVLTASPVGVAPRAH